MRNTEKNKLMRIVRIRSILIGHSLYCRCHLSCNLMDPINNSSRDTVSLIPRFDLLSHLNRLLAKLHI